MVAWTFLNVICTLPDLLCYHMLECFTEVYRILCYMS
jgi:hypothetical protein